jgi:hypothetical protein
VEQSEKMNCEICTQKELKKINPTKHKLSNGMFVCGVHFNSESKVENEVSESTSDKEK